MSADESRPMFIQPHRHIALMAMSCLLSVMVFLSFGEAAFSAGRSDELMFDPIVARRMGAFYEAVVERELAREEISRITDEFIRSRAKSGKAREVIRRDAGDFFTDTLILREAKGTAAAFTSRHQLLELNYFNPSMKNTLELRLMMEPDPVRVVDLKSRRLMTQRDIVALANIRDFAKSQAAPRYKELSRRQVDELVTVLNDAVGGNSGKMPQFFGEAAAFWAGVRQQWPYFNAEQRRLARAYANSTWQVSMPVEMYGSLLGLHRQAASKRWSFDVSARIAGRGSGNVLAVLDSY